MHQLVQACFGRPPFRIGAQIDPAIVRAALSIIGVGLDHRVGEQVLCFDVDGKWETATLLTTHRVLGVTGAVRYDMPYAQLLGVKAKTGLLDKRVFIDSPSGSECLGVNDAMRQPIAQFLSELLRHPPAARMLAGPPVCQPHAGDATGARGAAAHIHHDPELIAWLEDLDARFARGGATADIAQDLVARVSLLHRSERRARGMVDGWWTSPLASHDLWDAFRSIFGAPIAGPRADGAVVYASGLLTDDAGAGWSTALGLAATALVGVGWVTLAEERCEAVAIEVVDIQGAAGFRATDEHGRRLAYSEPSLLHHLDVALLPLERQQLGHRVAHGW